MNARTRLDEGCENTTRALLVASERAARTRRLVLCPTFLFQPSSALLAFVLLVLCLLSLTVQATIPAAATNDARYALGYLVVTNYPNVRNDGITDCTAGLRAAIQDAFKINKTFHNLANSGTPTNAGRPLAVWFPPGTYLITNVLECYSWTDDITHPPGGDFVLVGSTEGATRPRIVLAAGASSYQATNPPRPMIAFRIFEATNGTPIPVPDPMGTPFGATDISSALFRCDLRNIDLDCGGNPGAMGAVLAGAQFCSIENVRVYATNAFGGFYELPGAGGYAANVEVYGGRYGIIHGKYSPLGLTITAGGSGAVMVGIKLQDQTVAPILIGDGVATPTIVGFQFLNSKTLTIPYYGAAGGGTCYGTLTLLDGQISMSGSGNALAIDNTTNKNLYLRNVYISNTTNLVTSGTTTTTGTGTWKRIIEYSYNNPKDVAGVPPNSGYPLQEDTIESWSMVNGVVRDRTTTFPISPVVTNNCEAPPADLLSRHVWSVLPSYNGAPGDPATVVVANTAGLNNTNDDTVVIQAAIDATRSGNGRVYLPAGLYYITNTLTLHSNTVLMGAGWGTTWIQANPAWKPTSGEVVMMRTTDDANAATTLAWLCLRPRKILNTSETNYSRFNVLTWQAGRNSMLIGVEVFQPWTPTDVTQARSVVKYTGNGGGRWWGLAVGGARGTLNSGFRHLKISGTTEPLWLYGCNLEKGFGYMDGEVTGASNVRLLGLKREGNNPMLIITNCSNIAAYSGGALRDNPYYNGCFQVVGASTNILMANLNVHFAPGGEGSSDYMLYESITGQPATNILHPNNVSLYKRGELNDAIMIIGGGGGTGSPPGTPGNFTATAAATNRIDLSWSDVAGELNYRLDRQEGTGAFVNIAYPAADSPGYTDTNGVNPNTNYTYQLRAENAYGQSGWVNAGATTPPMGGGGTTNLAPEADTYARNGTYTNDNYGTLTHMDVRTGSAGNMRRAFLRFNLAGLSGTVSSAVLRLQVDNTTPGGNVTNQVWFVSTDTWSETGLTWNNMPARISKLAELVILDNQIGQVDFDVTSQVQTEFNGDGRISLEIEALNNAGNETVYQTREDSDPNVRPKLVIIADTNGTSTNSLRVQAISRGPPLAVSILSSSNRVYTLWSSPKLPPDWTPVLGQVGILGTGGLLELQDTNASPAQFYRVSVAVP